MIDLALSPRRLRSARTSKSLTQERSAQLAGITLRTLTRAEAGETELRASAVARLALVYGVPMEHLFEAATEGSGAEAQPVSPAGTGHAASAEPVGGAAA